MKLELNGRQLGQDLSLESIESRIALNILRDFKKWLKANDNITPEYEYFISTMRRKYKTNKIQKSFDNQK